MTPYEYALEKIGALLFLLELGVHLRDNQGRAIYDLPELLIAIQEGYFA